MVLNKLRQIAVIHNFNNFSLQLFKYGGNICFAHEGLWGQNMIKGNMQHTTDVKGSQFGWVNQT